MSSTWFGFYLAGLHVGWQQLARRPVQAPDGTSLLRREVLTAFRAGGDTVVSAFFAEAPQAEPLAWRRFGTLVADGERYVEAAAFERRGDELLHPCGDTTALPEVCYPGQLLLELTIGMLRSGPAELYATPIHDADGSLEAPVRVRVNRSLQGPVNATHRVDELPLDGGPARRSVLLAPDHRPERQVWGPETWSGPAMARALATAAGPADVPELAVGS